MKPLMIQGASSGAGKSLLTTAFARALSRRGIDVVPFKAQNMSNNARVVRGGEIGTAQYLQALAAGVEPDVRMNPVLIKPEADDRSQVIVLGTVDHELSARTWRERPKTLWPAIERSLRQLNSEHELVLIEGAGSPAEINLRDSDLANMRVAKLVSAAIVLVADIDRGGAFAHLYGTWALLDSAERALLIAFILNKFRGDAELLSPAPERLEDLTGIATIGVIPWLKHKLPDEDGAATPTAILGASTIAIIRYPTASNLDEFKQLEQLATVKWTADPTDVVAADLVVVPGSKHVVADLAWLREHGLDQALRQRATSLRRVLAICGGFQMLGTTISDPHGIDGDACGLGLLPVSTTFALTKKTRPAQVAFAGMSSPWAAVEGMRFGGYDIRHGTIVHGETGGEVDSAAAGAVLGVASHGMFERADILEALFGARPAETLDDTFDQLADALEQHVDVCAVVRQLTAGRSRVYRAHRE